MEVRIAFSETGTGESGMFDTTVSDISPESLIDAFRRLQQKLVSDFDGGEFIVNSIITNGNTSAFIMTTPDEPYFGTILWTGFIYTRFAGVSKNVV